MKDGFYKVWMSDHWNVGELRTVNGEQFLYLVGFDEAMNPEDFDIRHEIFMGKGELTKS